MASVATLLVGGHLTCTVPAERFMARMQSANVIGNKSMQVVSILGLPDPSYTSVLPVGIVAVLYLGPNRAAYRINYRSGVTVDTLDFSD